jgi:hypothetical protein
LGPTRWPAMQTPAGHKPRTPQCRDKSRYPKRAGAPINSHVRAVCCCVGGAAGGYSTMSRDVLHSSSGPFLAQTIATRSAHPQLASKQGTPTQPRPADLGALHDDVPLPIVSQELPPSQGFRTTAPPSASKHFAASALAICPLGSRRLHHGSTRSNPVHSLGGRPQTRARASTLSKQRNQSSRPSPAARAAAHASKSTSVASASAPPACKFPHLTNNGSESIP